MVSEDSPSNSNSSNLHQFIISNSIANQNHHFENHSFNPASYSNINNNNNPNYFPNSLPYISRTTTADLIHGGGHVSPSDDSDMTHERRLMDLLGTSNGHNHHQHHHNQQQQQRLSLSLGGSINNPCRLNPGLLNPGGYLNPDPDYQFTGPAFAAPHCSTSSYQTEPFAAVVGSSKYLKSVQSLLQEMVSVDDTEIDARNRRLVEKLSRKGSYGLSSDLKMELSNTEFVTEKHGVYISLLKLLALLEEVERRYEEYYHHMEDLVTSFEIIAGLGAGKSYTALALQAMSKHFWTLRSAIVSQIRATKQKIEKDMPKISSRLAQLSLLDQESRSNRVSLQQIGIMHSSRQAWRPIRGLPETSVTILRAWLFEHFLHPYPSDSEKLMLASQTGLSKNQVSNWFINARVRLWKPMIEEMYKEEFAESSTESDQLLTREGVGDSAEDFE
ncbi:hypothetical protein ACP275_03G068200 [Erythranthe tilingii]